MAAQPGKLLPRAATVHAPEERGVFHPGVDGRVPDRLPRRATVVGSLDELAEPAGGLRRVQPVRLHGRARKMVDLPAAEQRLTDIPSFALAIRRQDECAFARTNQHTYPAH